MKKKDKKHEEQIKEMEKDKNEIEIEVVKDSEEKPASHSEETKKTAEDKESELKELIEELEVKNQELKDTLLRKVAEFENYKRRTENDQLNLIKYAAESFIISILPIYNDLQRSIDHINEKSNIDSIKKGLDLVVEKFTKTLEEQGVKKIAAKGEAFDFNFHEALLQQKAEGVPPHTVIEEVEPGYIYKDKVIKHSKVVVSQEADDPEIEDESTNENAD